MAQVVKLKRTAVQGKIPTTQALELGELAINTYDGKLYFERDNGTPTIQSIVVTDAPITGSINIVGTVSASYFVGDGSGITNLPAADVSQVATVTASFDTQSTISVSHNFNSRNIIVSVYGIDNSQIIPASVTLTDTNTTTVTLSSAESGYVVVAKGGHIVSGSVDANNISGLGDKIVELTTYKETVSGNSTYNITHSLDEEYPIVQAWNTVSKLQEIPSTVQSINSNEISVVFSTTFSGLIIIKK
jgi:hypothetical protein